MTTINITQEMRNIAYEFSTNIIMQNNQFDRMHPANVRDINERNTIRINRTYVGKLAEVCFNEYLKANGIFVNIDDMFLIFEGQENVKDYDKVKETLQVTTFQHLFSMVLSEIELLKYTSDSQNLFDEMVNRLEKVIDIYHIEQLNGLIKLIFFYEASLGYMKQHRHTDALRMLEHFYHTNKHLSFPIKISGDNYFYTVDNWIEQNIRSGPYAPRNEQAIKDDLLNMLQKEPLFVPLHEDPKFKWIVNNLQRMFQSKRENGSIN